MLVSSWFQPQRATTRRLVLRQGQTATSTPLHPPWKESSLLICLDPQLNHPIKISRACQSWASFSHSIKTSRACLLDLELTHAVLMLNMCTLYPQPRQRQTASHMATYVSLRPLWTESLVLIRLEPQLGPPCGNISSLPVVTGGQPL